MNKTKTNINIQKEFWVIARHGNPKRYQRGTPKMDISLFEFDSVTEMNEFLGDKSCESGESMGDYVFKELAHSHSQLILNELEEDEKREAELQELEAQGRY